MATASLPLSADARTRAPHRLLLNTHVGLRPQSPGLFFKKRCNFSSALHEKVQQSVRSRLFLKRACRASIIMMPVGVVKVPYKTPGRKGYQWLDINDALYRDRVIMLSEYIDDNYSNLLLGSMLYLDSINSSEELNFMILGMGGDVTPCMQIYDTMESLESPVSTFLVGYAHNLIAYILAAGDKGKRSALPNSTIIIDPVAGAARGQADDVINEANELSRIRDYLFEQLAIKTGNPLEKIRKDFKNRMHFSSQEAVEYGLIDRIVRPKKFGGSVKEKAGDGLG